MHHHHRLRRNLKLFYAEAVFNGLIGILGPILVIFQMREIGLSLGQVLLGEAIMCATILLTEIPSGIFADQYGRKRCLLLAEGLFTLTMLFIAFAQSFSHIILGQILAGIGLAFSSGAGDALLYDTLKELKQEKTYKALLSKMHTIGFVIAIGSNIASGIIASAWGLRWPMGLAALFSGFSFLSLQWLTETRIHTPSQETNFAKQFKTSLRAIVSNRFLRHLMIFGMILGVGMKLSFHTLNPYWDQMGVPLALFGITLAGHNALAALMSWRGPRILQKLGDLPSLWWLLWIMSATFALMASWHWGIWGAMLLTALFQIPRALIPMAIDDLIHLRTESHQRATILSMHSFGKQGLQALMLPIFGWATGLMGLITALGWLGMLLLILGAISLRATEASMNRES